MSTEWIVDRENRDRLIDAMERYLNDELSAFDFDDEIFAIWDASGDPTVGYVVQHLWFFYDDLLDHPIHLNKWAWDYHYRLLLVLKSDFHVVRKHSRHWHWTQFLSAACLFSFGMFVIWWGFSILMLVMLIPLGAISTLLARWRRRNPGGTNVATTPFASISEVAATRRCIPGYKKRQYPAYLEFRRIRTSSQTFGLSLQSYAGWIVLSPLALFAHLLPDTETTTRVEVPIL